MVHEAAELRELRHEDVGVHDDGDGGGGGGGGASAALDGGLALVLKGWESLDPVGRDLLALTVISNDANAVNSLNGHRRNKGLPCMMSAEERDMGQNIPKFAKNKPITRERRIKLFTSENF